MPIHSIVAGGFGLKQIDAVSAYFQKPPPPDGVAGEAEHQGKPSEAKSGETRPQTTETRTTDDASTRTEAKDEDFERWPALELQEVAHTGRVTLPVVALVIVVDTVRRRRRKHLRIPHSPTA